MEVITFETKYAIINKYILDKDEQKIADKDAFLQEVKELCGDIENKNPYMLSYIESLDTSFVMYGVRGVKTQIAYILSNFRARTENDKEIKKLLQKLMKV